MGAAERRSRRVGAPGCDRSDIITRGAVDSNLVCVALLASYVIFCLLVAVCCLFNVMEASVSFTLARTHTPPILFVCVLSCWQGNDRVLYINPQNPQWVLSTQRAECTTHTHTYTGYVQDGRYQAPESHTVSVEAVTCVRQTADHACWEHLAAPEAI